MSDNNSKIPPPTFFDAIGQMFSRRDKLLEYLAVTDRNILNALIVWLKAQNITVPPEIQVVPTTITLPEIPGIPTPTPTPMIQETYITGLPVGPRPKGDIVKTGSIATPTTSYQTLADVTVTQGKRFQIAKIVASCAEDIIVQLYWAGQAIGTPYYVLAKVPFTDWFPLDYYKTTHEEYLRGDGSKKLELKAKIPSGGTADEVNGEIVGEETDISSS